MISKTKLQNALQEQMNQITPEKQHAIPEMLLKKLKRFLTTSKLKNQILDKVIFFYKFAFDPEYSFSDKTRYMVLGALLYFIIPMDLISDFIPGLGYLDDAMILKMVWNSLQDEIKRYQYYLELKNNNPA